VTNYTFTPGTAEKSPPGWFITDSDRITINNFHTSGEGGIIKNPRYHTTNTVINGEVMTDPTRALAIDDANATTLTNSTLGVIRLGPTVSTDGVRVTNATYASVECKPQPRATITHLTGITCSRRPAPDRLQPAGAGARSESRQPAAGVCHRRSVPDQDADGNQDRRDGEHDRPALPGLRTKPVADAFGSEPRTAAAVTRHAILPSRLGQRRGRCGRCRVSC